MLAVGYHTAPLFGITDRDPILTAVRKFAFADQLRHFLNLFEPARPVECSPGRLRESLAITEPAISQFRSYPDFLPPMGGLLKTLPDGMLVRIERFHSRG